MEKIQQKFKNVYMEEGMMEIYGGEKNKIKIRKTYM